MQGNVADIKSGGTSYSNMRQKKISHSAHLTIKTEMKFKQKAEANVPYNISENVL